MTSIKELAHRVLEVFHEAAERKGVTQIQAASLYKTFLEQAPHHEVQQAIEYLVDRDFIAPFSYSLTAKGMKKPLDAKEGA